MTRYDDMMQKMTVEEMVSLITQQPCRRCRWGNGDCNGKTRCALGVKRWLMEEKDIKAQGGIHAHWIKSNCYNVRGLIYECSNCNTVMFSAWNYCPNCGAKMIEPQAESEKT